MGRGRQKAKHTKVARELKYFSPETNYSALERELTGGEAGDPNLEDNLAKWAEYAGAEVDSDGDEADEAEDEAKRA
ncbi:unannotated protein [freshwater metagenome]|jgi:hypothetical protein|uniref:Unannotated protein n=1 Tax=freshwater metagenome TaxID=449393 RepID=A0A6J6EQ13_9ZZZZ|nr:DUF3073 family protein [Actinomycetota bacterium]